MTGITIVLGVALAVAVIRSLRLWAGAPIRYRHKPLGFTWGMAQQLALAAEGSVLVIEHEESPCFLQFRKAKDTGTPKQRIVFGFPDADWSSDYFKTVLRELNDEGFCPELVERRSEASSDSMRFLEIGVQGLPEEIGDRANELLRVVASAMNLPNEARFAFYVTGAGDPAIWRRANADRLREMASRGRHPVARWVARKQLDRLRRRLPSD